MPTLTIELPEDVREELEEVSRAEEVAVDELVADWVRREVAVRRFRRLAAETEPYFRKAGFTSEEQILREIS